LEANNSFLWKDGNVQSKNVKLNADNVFAIVSDNGAAINTNSAYELAKLNI